MLFHKSVPVHRCIPVLLGILEWLNFREVQAILPSMKVVQVSNTLLSRGLLLFASLLFVLIIYRNICAQFLLAESGTLVGFAKNKLQDWRKESAR